jgi:uncharacterized membrane protein
MSTINERIDVDAPVSDAYKQWLRVEDYPLIFAGVERVEPLGQGRLFWSARLAGRRRQWTTEFVEQQPEQTIAWRSDEAGPSDVRITLQPLSAAKTSVALLDLFRPRGLLERSADSLGLVRRRVRKELQTYKELVEKRADDQRREATAQQAIEAQVPRGYPEGG